ncbi:glycoside hydrolase [Rhodoplanes roseus]|uniref:NlpC/P60 domain-containing protein n=1 Tax=Rhodoplanes roseus TaxID=29409 RepID=A0A327L163_9BRAD|nr:glycoside hydrolase [Rhodoplanes roseus]RAI44699.1 hypothetical protein CH341_07735 [Rhodoplanes roseus]
MTDAAAYVSALIGRPWDRTGLHCGALVQQVQRDLFGRSLPDVMREAPPCDAEGRLERYRVFAEHPAHGDWQQALRPTHGCLVLMRRRSGRPHEHVGVWLALDGGGVLHTDAPHGVVFDSLAQLALRGWLPTWFVPVR